jgi:hypothetical protein
MPTNFSWLTNPYTTTPFKYQKRASSANPYDTLAGIIGAPGGGIPLPGAGEPFPGGSAKPPLPFPNPQTGPQTGGMGGLMGNVFGGDSGGQSSIKDLIGQMGGITTNGDVGIGEPLAREPGLYGGGPESPTAETGGTTVGTQPAAAAFDFWTSIKDILGDSVNQDQFDSLQQAFQARNNWRVPKNAQDMLDTAKLMKVLGMDDEAASLAFQAINMGYRQPKWDLNTLFGPLFQSWGLQYGASPTAAR